MRTAARTLFATRRGLTLVARSAAVFFGGVGAAVQLYWAFGLSFHVSGLVVLAVMAVGALAWGVVRPWPRQVIGRNLRRPDVTVEVRVGDLFDQGAHLVVGYTDTFDTELGDDEVISPASVQGQFQRRIYDDDLQRLDQDLRAALVDQPVLATERPEDKRGGKLDRYPMGTVAVLGQPARRYFCVAYSRMGNNLVAKSTISFLWESLDSLWDAVYARGKRGAVAIPIIGSELARVHSLDRENLLKMIILSFVARSREESICERLIVVIHPKDAARINMLEVEAFLRAV